MGPASHGHRDQGPRWGQSSPCSPEPERQELLVRRPFVDLRRALTAKTQSMHDILHPGTLICTHDTQITAGVTLGRWDRWGRRRWRGGHLLDRATNYTVGNQNVSDVHSYGHTVRCTHDTQHTGTNHSRQADLWEASLVKTGYFNNEDLGIQIYCPF